GCGQGAQRSDAAVPRLRNKAAAGLGARQGHEAESRTALFGRMLLAPDFIPLAGMARIGDGRVTIDVLENFGEFDNVGKRQEPREQLRAADDRHTLALRELERLI